RMTFEHALVQRRAIVAAIAAHGEILATDPRDNQRLAFQLNPLHLAVLQERFRRSEVVFGHGFPPSGGARRLSFVVVSATTILCAKTKAVSSKRDMQRRPGAGS